MSRKVEEQYHSEKELWKPTIAVMRSKGRELVVYDNGVEEWLPYAFTMGELKKAIMEYIPYLDGDHKTVDNGKQKRIESNFRNLVSHRRFIRSGLVDYQRGYICLTELGESIINEKFDLLLKKIRKKTLYEKNGIQSPDVDIYDYSAPEGSIIERKVKQRQRNPALARKARKAHEKENNGLCICAACGWIKPKSIDINIINMHHSKSVSQMLEGEETTVGSFIPLCPTCHAMSHSESIPLSVDEIKDANRENSKLKLEWFGWTKDEK